MMQIEGIKLEAFITGVIIFGRHKISVPRGLQLRNKLGVMM